MNEVVSHGCLHQTVWVARVTFTNLLQVWSTWFDCDLYDHATPRTSRSILTFSSQYCLVFRS